MRILTFLFLVQEAVSLYPVRDFRVSDLATPGFSKLVLGSATSKTTLFKTATNSSSTSPTFILSDDTQMLYTDDTQSIYYVNSQISDPSTSYNETFSLLLDTGSPFTWVYNVSCTENACKNADVVKFNDSKSIKYSSEFKLQYAGQTVEGEMFSLSDNKINFNLDGMNPFQNLSIGLTGDSPSMFDGFNISGILGIPSSGGSAIEGANIISQLSAEKLVNKQQFGLYVVSDTPTINYVSSKNQSLALPQNFGGLIFFGEKAENNPFYNDDIHYASILDNTNQYWLINITDVTITNTSGSQTPFNSTQNSRNAIVDTGTTGLVLPSQDAEDVHKLMFGNDLVSDNNGNFAFPCNNTNSQTTLSIGGKDFNISSKDIMGQEYSNSNLNGYCASKIQGIEEYDYWVLGVSFLNKYYTVFDLDERKIGFVEKSIDSYTLKQHDVASSKPAGTASASSSSSASASASSSTSKPTSSDSSSKSGASTFKPGHYVSLVFMAILMYIL